MSEKDVKIFPTIDELNKFAANEFVRLSRDAIEKRGQFTVALSGGSTPKKLYALLASDEFCSQIDWKNVYFFFGDERLVAPDSEESNYNSANVELFLKPGISQENIFRFLTENGDAKTIAEKMQNKIQSVFNLQQNEFPRFDLIFLGMGSDGHTASLFPETSALNEKRKIIVENFVPKFQTYRLTFTFSTINNARNIIFLIAGEDKAEVLKKVLEGETKKYPSQDIKPVDGNLIFLVDKEAAKFLESV